MRLLSGVVVCVVCFLSANTNAAEWSASVKVTSVRPTAVNVYPAISIQGMCVNSNVAYVDPTQENYSEVFSLLLAAMMADKEVKFSCDGNCASATRCRVVEVQVFK